MLRKGMGNGALLLAGPRGETHRQVPPPTLNPAPNGQLNMS